MSEWERHWNADHDAYYYHNPATNETVWTEPESWHDAAPDVQHEQEQEAAEEYAPEEDVAPADEYAEEQQLEEPSEAEDTSAAYGEAEPAAAEDEWDAQEQAEAGVAEAVEAAAAAEPLAAMEVDSEESEEEEDDEAAALRRAGLSCAWRTVPDNKGGVFYLNQLTDQTTYDEPEAHRVWRLSQEGASDALSSAAGTPLKRRASLLKSAESVSSAAAEEQQQQQQQRDADAMEVEAASVERKSADRAAARAKAAKATAAAAAEEDDADDAYFAAATILPPPAFASAAAAAAAAVPTAAKARAKAVPAPKAAAAAAPAKKVPKTAADFAAVMRDIEEELCKPDAVMEARAYGKLREYMAAAGAQASAAAAEAAAEAVAAAESSDAEDTASRPSAAAAKRAANEVVNKAGQAGLQLLINNYKGYAQYAVLAGQWLQATNSGSDAPAAATSAATSSATTVSAAAAAAAASAEDVDPEELMLAQLEKALFAAFNSGRADTLKDIPRWLGELQESPRWRKVLVRLFDAHRDSALLRYVLKQLSDRGHHAEIAVTVSVADIFHVFNGVLQDCLGQVSVSRYSV
jgi:TH1 protein